MTMTYSEGVNTSENVLAKVRIHGGLSVGAQPRGEQAGGGSRVFLNADDGRAFPSFRSGFFGTCTQIHRCAGINGGGGSPHGCLRGIAGVARLHGRPASLDDFLVFLIGTVAFHTFFKALFPCSVMTLAPPCRRCRGRPT